MMVGVGEEYLKKNLTTKKIQNRMKMEEEAYRSLHSRLAARAVAKR
jgi:hypothetical protein